MRSSFILVPVLGLALGAGPALLPADKMQTLGLTPEGKPLAIEQPAQKAEPPAGVVHFHTAGHGKVAVERPALLEAKSASAEQQARALVETLVAGPTEQEMQEKGAQPLFPEGTDLRDVTLNEHDIAEVRLVFPEWFIDGLRDDELMYEHLAHALKHEGFDLPLSGFQLLGLDRDAGEFKPLDDFVPLPDFLDPEKDLSGLQNYHENWTAKEKQLAVPADSSRPTGSLTNRRLYHNAGHGWYWTGSRYAVQRSFVFNNIEDFSNADLVHHYLDAYLYNAGGEVFHVREPDPNPNMVIVDNDDGAPDYVETGEWQDSSVSGFANGHMPYGRLENPFSFGTNRIIPCTTDEEPTATATWIPTIPESGFYNVYVSHAAWTNRSPQAEYIIRHAGGETKYYIDQRRNRNTWIFIGRYFFEEGRDDVQASVTLTNRSTSSGHWVSADAVRFGGGMGVINAGGEGTSGRLRYDEEAVYHMAFSGAPTSVHRRFASNNDMQNGWSGRPRFGAWLQDQSTEYGAPPMPATFLSHHTNATATGAARGTISYLHPNHVNTIHDDFRRAVHPRVVNSLVQGYGAGFNQNSNPYRETAFGENNPNNSGGIPIFLGEWLFHDNAQDMALYHDPKFRRLMARGIYHGIVDFYADEIGGPTTYLPEPPRNFRANVTGPDEVTLEWHPPMGGNRDVLGDPATGYRVYMSTHGRGFPPPEETSERVFTFSDLEPGKTYYFRISATNDGGESFPTETLAAKLPENADDPHLLIVSGFDKLDIATRVQTSWGSGTLYRQFAYQMNSFDYIVEHGRAIDAWDRPVSFDSVEHDVIELISPLVDLADYDAVIWIGGLQAEVSTIDPTDDTALKTRTRGRLADYLDAGGRLFISGAEIGWDLDRLGDTTFMNDSLKFDYVDDGSDLGNASGAPGSVFEGLNSISFGGSNAPYAVHWPDIIETAGGSTAAMHYGLPEGTVLIDGFESIGEWRHPGFSGQTNADPASTFSIASSPVRSGSGSGHLHYVWGDGDFIRQHNRGLPEFPAASDFSIWVYGDNSGHQVRILLRDAAGNLFVNEWLVIDFEGWQEIVWEDIINNPQNPWATTATEITGPNVRFDSIQVEKVTEQNSGDLYFDDATYTAHDTDLPDSPVAAVQYDGGYKLVHMGFPFETIEDEEKRNDLMGRVLDFFEFETPVSVDSWHVF